MAENQKSTAPKTPSRATKSNCLARFIAKIKRALHECCTENEKESSQDRSSRRTATATIWIAIFAVVAGAVGISQAIIANRQLNAMQGQLDAMEADQRPWVFANNVIISRPIIRDEQGTHISLKFILKNGGRSPALQTAVRFKAYLRSLNYLVEEKIICGQAQKEGLGTTVFQDTGTVEETGWLIPTAEIDAAKKANVLITPFIIACVSYRSYKTQEFHTTPYEMTIGPAIGSKKWPCCAFPIDEQVIEPADLQITLLPISSAN